MPTLYLCKTVGTTVVRKEAPLRAEVMQSEGNERDWHDGETNKYGIIHFIHEGENRINAMRGNSKITDSEEENRQGFFEKVYLSQDWRRKKSTSGTGDKGTLLRSRKQQG